MIEWIAIPINGCLLDTSEAVKNVVKLEWVAIKQSNTNFNIEFQEFKELEKKLRTLINGGKDFWTKFWKHALIELGCDPTPAKLRNAYEKFITLFLNQTRLYPDVEPFLKQCREKKIKTALITNNSQTFLNKFLNKYELKKYFNEIINVEEHQPSQPIYYRKITEKLGENVLFICTRRDTEVKAVKENNYQCGLVLRKFYEKINKKNKPIEDYTFKNLKEITKINAFEKDAVKQFLQTNQLSSDPDNSFSN